MARRAAAAIRDQGGEAIGLQVDMRCYEQITRSVDRAVAACGSVGAP